MACALGAAAGERTSQAPVFTGMPLLDDSATSLRGAAAGDEGLVFGMAVGPEGRFELRDKLGQGGMGEVWLALDRQLSKEHAPAYVALKFLTRYYQRDPQALEFLRAEVIRSQKLTHPNIVRIFDLHTHHGAPFIKMEYVQGNSLQRWLDLEPAGVLPAKLVVRVARQVAEALDYAHLKEGIIHRDLKPGNLLWNEETQTVKLSDFGIAAEWRHLEDDQWCAGAGTLLYASPQQLAGAKPAPEDDIYALGATLYALLTGSAPFESGSRETLMAMIRHQVPDPIPDRLAALRRANETPSKLRLVIQRCLEKDPLNRPKAREVLRLLPPDDLEAPPPEPPSRLPVVAPSLMGADTPAQSVTGHGGLVLVLVILAALGGLLAYPPLRTLALAKIRLLVYGRPPMELAITSGPTSLGVGQGGTAVLAVEAGGVAPLKFRWRKNGEDLLDTSDVAGADSPRLTLGNVTPAATGAYLVVVSDGRARTVTSAVATLSLTSAPAPTVVETPTTGTLLLQVPSPTRTRYDLQWEALADSGTRISGAFATGVVIQTNLAPGHYVVRVTAFMPEPWKLEEPVVIEADRPSNPPFAFVYQDLTIESIPKGAKVSWSPQNRMQFNSKEPTSDHASFTKSFRSGVLSLHFEQRGYRSVTTNYVFHVAQGNQPRVLTVRLERQARALPEDHEPWTNFLQMAFLPLPGPEGQRLWACQTETTVGQFRYFMDRSTYGHSRPSGGMYSLATGPQPGDRSWADPGFAQTEQHPVVGVNLRDAVAFCEWLTEVDRTNGCLLNGQKYVLPTTNQWFLLAGPASDRGVFPWGNDEKDLAELNPAAPHVGNYAGLEVEGSSNWPAGWEWSKIFNDGYPRTAPVNATTFKRNPFGFLHVGGNVAEWCEPGVMCGGSWMDAVLSHEQLKTEHVEQPPANGLDERNDWTGFRVFFIDSGDEPP